MSYKVNGGIGAVICDECKVVFDSHLSYEEYLRVYKEGPDYCWEHKDCREQGGEQECKPLETA